MLISHLECRTVSGLGKLSEWLTGVIMAEYTASCTKTSAFGAYGDRQFDRETDVVTDKSCIYVLDSCRECTQAFLAHPGKRWSMSFLTLCTAPSSATDGVLVMTRSVICPSLRCVLLAG